MPIAVQLVFLAAAVVALGTSALPVQVRAPADISPAYDFVVIGGGTAGLTVAARISEANATVLLLEAGGAPNEFGLPYLTPSLTSSLQGSAIDWNFTAVADLGLGNRSLTQQRGFCLGGTSAINGMTYGRGSASIYDAWAEMNGDDGWRWENLQEDFIKTFQFGPLPGDQAEAFATYDASLYAQTAPGELGYTAYSTPLIGSFVEAVSAINISSTRDLNNGVNIGAKHELSTLNTTTQERVSSHGAFYETASARPNFHAVTNALVTRVLFDGTKAVGVEYNSTVKGETTLYNVTVGREIVLSAGTLATPQLLMLSGIGPNATLAEFGIPSIINNENVGKNLQDSPNFAIVLESTDEASTQRLNTNATMLAAAELEYAQNQTGPLASLRGITGPAYAFGQYNATEQQELNLTALGASATMKDSAHYELIQWSHYSPDDEGQHSYLMPADNTSYISVAAYLLAPFSEGSITISSTNPADWPVINLNYFEDPRDMTMAIRLFRKLREVIATPAFQQNTVGTGTGEVVPGLNYTTDAQIERFIRDTVISAAHQSGTAAMAPLDQRGVVDSRLRVYGVQGLRVADASIMPSYIDQHPQASIYMIAEKAAGMILSDNSFA